MAEVLRKLCLKIHVHTCASIGDPVVLHCDRGGLPLNGDAGRGGRCYSQVSGSIGDWRGLEEECIKEML